MIGLRDTRGVEWRESLIFFNNSLLQILQALECISTWNDVTSSLKVDCFMQRWTSTDFIISIKIINSIFIIIYSLSITLQKTSLHVNIATKLINSTRKMIQNVRDQADIKFNVFRKTIKEFCEQTNIESSKPRLSVKQTNRPNVPCYSWRLL